MVTYLGFAGTFAEQALWDTARAGEIDPAGESAVNAVPVDSPAAALGAVHRGEVDFACVAIESNVDGPVTSTFNALTVGLELQIFRETEVEVVLSILVCPGTTAEQVRTFITHPVAYPQVKQWMDANLSGVEVHQASSSAAATHQVAEGTHDAYAAPACTGGLFGLEALATEVADVCGARTHFLLVECPGVPTPRTGVDHTSVSFTLPNQPGTLMYVMNEFAMRQVNPTRIESRPTRELFGFYRFYIDCNGHVDDTQVAAVPAALHEYTEDLRYLGSWPVAEGGRRSIMAPPPDISQSIKWVDVLKEGRRQNMTLVAPENPVRQLPFLDDRPGRLESVMPVDSQRTIFVRHGQTTGNTNCCLDTALPGVPFTDLSVRQVCSLGRLLPPDVHRTGDIVTSHALRARQTGADAVAGLYRLGETSVHIRHEGGPHEIQVSDLEGCNDRSAHMEYMCAFYQWLNGELEYRLPGGESGADALNHYLLTLQQLLEQVGVIGSESRESRKGGSKDAVIISHDTVIRLIGQYLTGVDSGYALRHHIANTERIEPVPSAAAVGKYTGIEPGMQGMRRWGDSELPQTGSWAMTATAGRHCWPS